MFIKIISLFYILLFINISVVAQPTFIISTKAQYDSSINANKKNKLINLKKLISGLIVDLKYATPNNFTKKKLYKKATTTYLRFDAAHALLAIQQSLNSQGFALKIFDAYRPYSVTKLMWDLIHDERYVANPKSGSGHNKGTSVDLTIVETGLKKELDMGTEFDNFTEQAHHSYTPNFDSTIRSNRNLLKSTMEKFGFKSLETEWWHYSWNSSEKFDVIDINFKKLRSLVF